MRAEEFILESIDHKPGDILDLTKNYPQYTKLLARIESIKSTGHLRLVIVRAVGTKNTFTVGQRIQVAPNYVRRCPTVYTA